MMLQLHQEYGTMLLVVMGLPTVCGSRFGFKLWGHMAVCINWGSNYTKAPDVEPVWAQPIHA